MENWTKDKINLIVNLIKRATRIESIKDPKYYNDIDIILFSLRHDGTTLKMASEELKNNPEIVMTAVTNYSWSLQWASEELKNNYEIVMAAVTNDGNALQFASENLKDNKEIVMAAVTNVGNALRFASEKFKDDIEIVMAAITNNGQALYYVSDKLKGDYEIVKIAIKNDIKVTNIVSEELKKSRDFFIEFLELYKKYLLESDIYPIVSEGDIMRMWNWETSPQFYSDKEIILKALPYYGAWIIEYIDPELKADKDFIIEAIDNDPTPGIRNLREPQPHGSLPYYLQQIKSLGSPDYNILSRYSIIKQKSVPYNCVFLYAVNEIKSNKDIEKKALHQAAKMMIETEILRTSYSLDKKKYRRNISAFNISSGNKNNYIWNEFRTNKELIFKAIKNGLWIDLINSLPLDRTSGYNIETGLERLSNRREWPPKPLHSSVIWKYTKQLFPGPPPEYMCDKDFWRKALNINGLLLFCVIPSFKSDKELVTIAINNNAHALKFVSDELKSDKKFIIDSVKAQLKQQPILPIKPFNLYSNPFDEYKYQWWGGVWVNIRVGQIENGTILHFINEHLKSDIDFIYKLLEHTLWVMEIVPQELLEDKEFVLNAVKINGLALYFVSPDLKKDKDIILEAVKQDGLALGFIEMGKINKQMLLEAVKQNGLALRFYQGNKSLLDKSLVLEAVKQNGLALNFTPSRDEYRSDKEIILEAVNQNNYAIVYAEDPMPDRDVINILTNNNLVNNIIKYGLDNGININIMKYFITLIHELGINEIDGLSLLKKNLKLPLIINTIEGNQYLIEEWIKINNLKELKQKIKDILRITRRGNPFYKRFSKLQSMKNIDIIIHKKDFNVIINKSIISNDKELEKAKSYLLSNIPEANIIWITQGGYRPILQKDKSKGTKKNKYIKKPKKFITKYKAYKLLKKKS